MTLVLQLTILRLSHKLALEMSRGGNIDITINEHVKRYNLNPGAVFNYQDTGYLTKSRNYIINFKTPLNLEFYWAHFQ